MIIDQFPRLTSPQSGDELPIERGQTVYKIDYNALATAIINKLGGDPVTVAHGGFGGTTVAQARTNLSVYSKAETNSAISQSTATLNLNFSANDDTWGEIFTILSPLDISKSAFFIAQSITAGVLTNGKLSVAVKGIVNHAGTGVYDFIAFTGYQPQYIWIWRISGFTSGSVTPTVSAVYRFTGTAI